MAWHSGAGPGRFEDANIRALLRGALVAPFILLTVLAAIFGAEIRYFVSLSRWVIQTQEGLVSSRQVFRRLIDLETGVRGYVLTRDQSFLSPYAEASSRLPALLSELEQSVSGEPLQLRKVKALRTLLDDWQTRARHLLARVREGGNAPDADAHIAGKEAMDGMRELMQSVIEQQEHVVEDRAARSARMAMIVTTSTIALAGLLGIGIGLLARGRVGEVVGHFDGALRAMRDKAGALAESEERFRLLLEDVRDYAIFMVDPEGRVASWNLGAERMLGYAAGDILGKPRDLLYPAEEVSAGVPQRDMTRTLEGGRVELEGWRVRKDGSRLWANIVLTPMRDDSGRLRGISAILHDETERKRTEDALRESEERFRLLVSGVRDYAIMMLDPVGRVASWNLGAERIHGYQTDEVLGKPFSVFYPPDAVERGFPEVLLGRAKTDGQVEHQGWRVRQDGSRFWADTLITVLRDEVGRLRGFAKITRDATERKRAEDALRESEERFRMLVERVADYAIFFVDPFGSVASWNLGAERITGYDAEAIAGKPYSLLYTSEETQHVPAEDLERALKVGRVESQGWRARRDGSRFFADSVLTMLRDETGRLRGFSVILRDVTGLRQASEERERLYRDAQAAIAVRDEFLAIASHELKTPLASASLEVQNLLSMARRAAPEHRFTAELAFARLSVVNRQLERLTSLIWSLLDVSRVRAGQLELERSTVDLAALVRDTLERSRPELERAECETVVRAEDPVLGQWDRSRLEQVFSNLLSNAVKYGAERPIEIEVSADASTARLSIRDHGIGISRQMQEQIFERFERGVPSKHFGGLGLGLWLVREIVRAHGGNVTVRSEPGAGATFTVELPRRSPAGKGDA